MPSIHVGRNFVNFYLKVEFACRDDSSEVFRGRSHFNFPNIIDFVYLALALFCLFYTYSSITARLLSLSPPRGRTRKTTTHARNFPKLPDTAPKNIRVRGGRQRKFSYFVQNFYVYCRNFYKTSSKLLEVSTKLCKTSSYFRNFSS